LSVSPLAGLFEKAVRQWGFDPEFAAVILIQYPKRLKRKGLPEIGLDPAVFEDVFAALREKRLYREGVLPVLEAVLAGGRPVGDCLPEAGGAGDPRVDALRIARILTGLRFQDGARRMRQAMGLLMAEWRGRIAGAEAARMMAEHLEKVKA
jgi:Glu-tRNA(Gln) amidotransferase subunit E-like FAD-binding protein